MAPNDRIIVADILPTRLREEADKVGTEQASLLREAAGRIRTLTDWTRNLRDSLRKADAEASRLRHCDEALRMLGFNDEHCKTNDPLVYAEALLQSLRVNEQSDLAAAAERERIVKRRHRPYPLERDTWRTKSGATWTVVDAGLTHQRQRNRVVTLVCQCGARLELSLASFLRRFILVDGRGVGIDITDILVAADGGVVLRQHRAGVGVLLGLPLDAAGLAELRQRLLDDITAEDCAREGFPELTPAEFCVFYRRQA